MKEWPQIQKRYTRLEQAGIGGILLCLMIGLCSDWNVLVRKDVWIVIEDIGSFSLTILQIQATVGTLIIAIIALIAGNISDSYMGVSVSDFYLNIRPWKLKQKILIFLSLGLCMIGVISHSLKLYNTVFYLFVATWIVIAVSITEIYSAFRGKNTGNIEIAAYINFMLESSAGFSKKEKICQHFVLDWKEIIDSQDKQSYEKYVEIFEKCMLSLWDYGMEQSLGSIQRQCFGMAYCLLGSEKNITKERGIEFVQKVYDVLWEAIRKDVSRRTDVINKGENGFYLFSEICGELIQGMETLHIESLERRLNFNRLTDSVQRVAIWTRYDAVERKGREAEQEKDQRNRAGYNNEIDQLSYFARYLGRYLGERKTKGDIVCQTIWANVLNKWSTFFTFNVPEERCEDFLKAKVQIYFNYCFGMLLSGQENVVKQGLYLTGMRNIVKLDNKYQALFYLLVHCYIYYLAERESDNCVSENIRQGARNLLEDREVNRAFKDFLNLMAANAKWLDRNIPKLLYALIERYELSPMYDNVKITVMQDVVSDFYLFLILFMEQRYFLPVLPDKNIDDMEAARYVEDGNKDKTKEMLKSLYTILFAGEKSDKEIEIEVGLMYASLEKTVKRKYKARCLDSAIEDQKKYKSKVDEKEICGKLKAITVRRIKEKFAPILVEDDEKNGLFKAKLLSLQHFTQTVQKEKLDGCFFKIDDNLLSEIECFLYKRNAVELKRRSKETLINSSIFS